TLAPLSVHLSDLSLTTPLHVEMSATTSGTPAATVHVRGTLGPLGDPPFAADVPIDQRVTLKGGAVEVSDLAVSGRVRRTESGAPIASLHLAAPSLRASGVEVTALDLTAGEHDGTAVLDRLAFSVFGGTVEGKGRVDHSGTSPAFTLETKVRNVDVAQALAVRAPDMGGRFEGRLDADSSIAGTAGDDAVVRRTLTGTGAAHIRNAK